MVNDCLPGPVSARNSSTGLIRCFDLDLKGCKFGLQCTYTAFQKLFGAFRNLFGFNHCAIGILNGDIGCYIDLFVICVLEVIKVCYSLRKEIDLGRKRRNRHDGQCQAQSQQNSQQSFWFCFHIIFSFLRPSPHKNSMLKLSVSTATLKMDGNDP